MTNLRTSNVLLSRSFLLAFFSFFFLWISFDFFILFPLFILRKGGTTVDVGFQEAIFFIPSVFVRPFFGLMIDRLGRLKILWSGTILMIVTSLCFLLLHESYAQMKWYVSLILIFRGTGFAAFYTSFFTYITDLTTTENRGRVIGLFGVSGLVAHGLAPWIGEKVLARFDFPGFFETTAALAAFSLTLSLFLKEKATLATVHEKIVQSLKGVAFSKKNLVFLPGGFVFGWVIASFNTFGAPFFEKAGGATVGQFFLVYGITAGIFRIIFGGLVDRYPRGLLISLFFVLQGAGVAMIVLEPIRTFYLASAASCGAAHAILFPSMVAQAIDAHSEKRGVVSSIFTAIIELGFSLGSFALGWVISLSGYRVMFGSCAVVALVFAAYVMALPSTRRRAIRTI